MKFKFNLLVIILFVLVSPYVLALPTQNKTKPNQQAEKSAKKVLHPAKESEIEAEVDTPNIRVKRPVSIALAGLGKHPLIGLALDFQLFKNLGIGSGISYFSVGSVKGFFIPVYLRGSILDFDFTPYIDFGLDFVSVKFESKNSLLSSTFKGTQVIVGGGLEYRFRFGLVSRLNAVYYTNAKILAPGMEIGYSFPIDLK